MTNTEAATEIELPVFPQIHSHVFLGKNHEGSERRTWAVIWLCGAMMVAEIVGGKLFGSLALIADGLHMSTHAGALLLAALAYSYARKHAHDDNYVFGTGKVGDLAGYTSAIILATIALLIGYEAVMRFMNPITIHFGEAIPIAVLGLAVNAGSAWLLSAGGHHHHGHGHHHSHDHGHHDETRRISLEQGVLVLEVFEDGVPPRFRVRVEAATLRAEDLTIETVRQDGKQQIFSFVDQGEYLESPTEIPEPHEFTAKIKLVSKSGTQTYQTEFEEHAHGAENGRIHIDHNMRAALIHVMADAAVSILVIIGLCLAYYFGWLWMDPLAGMVGACVLASWSYGLMKDTSGILLDRNPDHDLTKNIRSAIEASGDKLTDLHLWRLGPGHMGAILSVATSTQKSPAQFKTLLSGFPSLSHVTVEVIPVYPAICRIAGEARGRKAQDRGQQTVLFHRHEHELCPEWCAQMDNLGHVPAT